MSPMTALWASILLGGTAQILLKRGLMGSAVSGSARSPLWWLRLLRSGWIWAWGMSFVLGTVLWLLAVSSINISYAFPLVSMSYVFVALLSRILLGEQIPSKRWAAIGLICLGVVLITQY